MEVWYILKISILATYNLNLAEQHFKLELAISNSIFTQNQFHNIKSSLLQLLPSGNNFNQHNDQRTALSFVSNVFCAKKLKRRNKNSCVRKFQFGDISLKHWCLANA
jgi:hypothetical protein